MKGFVKGMMIFSLVCFIIGIILTISGVIIGARFSDIFDRIGNRLTDLDDLSLNDLTFSKNYDGVEKIELDVSYGNVEIIYSESESVKVDILSRSIQNSYSCDLTNGTLKLKTKNRNKFSFGDNDINIKLYIPEGVTFEKFDIQIGACNLYADKIMASKLSIEVGAGNLDIKDIVSDKCKVECGLGNIDIKSIDVKESLDIDCGMGSVKASMFGDREEFNYKVECSLGNVDFDGKSYASFINSVKETGNGEKKINIECGMGNVDISFINE